MAQSSLIKVFVYGTLKNGYPNHHYLTNKLNGIARLLTIGRTKRQFPMVIGTRYNIPFVLDRPGEGHQIAGEIYEVDDEMFSHLDILEDYPNLYGRHQEDILTVEGLTFSCWMYLLKEFPDRLLKLPHLSEYKPTVDQPYLEKSKRIENIPAKSDL